jgi:alcohol dehydrogenase (cytochrome c)
MPKLIYGAACVAVATLFATAALAQTADDLKADASTTDNVLTLGMGQGQQRYSALDQINKKTVKRLVPVWNFSLNDGRGQESQPLIYKGVMYVTTHQATHAIDAKTGKQIWQHKIEYPPETPRIVCCGILNRGAAIYDGKIFRTTLDANVLALDAATGKQLWLSDAASVKDSYSMTVAPLVANGVVITGISGGEYGVRGFIDGWDSATGRHLWRRFTTAAPGEKGGDTWPGDTHKQGAAPTWITGSYDADLDLVYWGTGNGGPWNAEFRKGDNLYVASVLALKPKTGEIAWHYQFSPNSRFDHDGVNENVMADIEIDGKMHKVIMHADRNGYFYVIDRTNGKLLAANSFVDNLNWADGIDMKTGRPIMSETTKKLIAGETVEVWPGAFGGKNWMPMSYNPKTGLAYANTLELGMVYAPVEPKFVKNAFYLGYDLGKAQFLFKKDGAHSYLRAIDPKTGKAKWKVANDVANWSGTMTTGGGLVFVGALTGEFHAYDADNGDHLWQFQTGSGIIGQPVTWEQDGRQYVSVASGIGGAYSIYMPLLGASNKELVTALSNMQPGGSVWTFALIEE